MNNQKELSSKQQTIRQLLRVIGPIVVGVGLIFMIIGIGSFFAAFGSFGPPKYFWCAFVGMPILAVGIALCKFGYMGAVARYYAGEIAPVAKDTFNYMADGTQEGVKTFATAVGEGFSSSYSSQNSTTILRCYKCNEENDSDAKFCSNCGTALLKSKSCPQCNELNDPDAKFCDNCGHNFI